MNLKETLYNINRTKESFFNIDKGKFINYDVLRNGILIHTASFRKWFNFKYNNKNKFISHPKNSPFIWISLNPQITIPSNKDVNLSYKGYFTK